jgi:hypothetical protein
MLLVLSLPPIQSLKGIPLVTIGLSQHLLGVLVQVLSNLNKRHRNSKQSIDSLKMKIHSHRGHGAGLSKKAQGPDSSVFV